MQSKGWREHHLESGRNYVLWECGVEGLERWEQRWRLTLLMVLNEQDPPVTLAKKNLRATKVKPGIGHQEFSLE